MSADSPASILFDINGNPIGVIIDGAIYRLQVEAKIADGYSSGLALESTLAKINAKLNSLGQKIATESVPVVLASNQSPIAVTSFTPDGYSTNNPSVGASDGARLGFANQIGGTDGGSLRSIHVHDLDTSITGEYNLGVSLRLPGSGGSVIGGTLSNPIRINPTGTTAQPVTDNGGSLTVDGAVNADVRVGGLVISNTNPIPISDAGGSITIDGYVTLSGSTVTILDGGNVISVDDAGGSLTIDNPALSVVGGGLEATALRVTIASDSTGLISVDDNGASLTIDTTQLPTSLIAGRLDTNNGAWLGSTAPTVGQKTSLNSIPVTIASDQPALSISDGGGSITIDGYVSILGPVDTELTTANLNTGAGVDTRAVIGLVYGASGGGVLVSTTNPLPIGDNGGSITVDTTQLPTTLVGGRLDNNIGSWLGSTVPTVGQKTSANSIPVVLPSDQAITVNNPSVGINNAATPASSTQIAGSDGTILRPIATTASGQLKTVSGDMAFSGVITTASGFAALSAGVLSSAAVAAGSAVAIPVAQFGVVGVSVTGTFTSGSLAFEASIDSVNWFAINGVVSGSGAQVMSISSATSVRINSSGYQQIRVRAVIGFAGSVTVAFQATGNDSLTTISAPAIIAGKDAAGNPQPFRADATGVMFNSLTTPGLITNLASSGPYTRLAPNYSLRVQQEPSDLFKDKYDGTVLDPNKWTTTSNASSATVGLNSGSLALTTGTTNNAFASISSVPLFEPEGNVFSQLGSLVVFPAVMPTNVHFFHGYGTGTVANTALNPLTDAVGYEVDTTGSINVVIYSAGVKIFSQSITTYTAAGSTPINNGQKHRLDVFWNPAKVWWVIDGEDKPAVTKSFEATNIQTLPVRTHIYNGGTLAASATFRLHATAVTDTGHNNMRISDGTYGHRKMRVGANGETYSVLTSPNNVGILAAGVSPYGTLRTTPENTSEFYDPFDGSVIDPINWLTPVQSTAGIVTQSNGNVMITPGTANSAYGVHQSIPTFVGRVPGFAQVGFALQLTANPPTNTHRFWGLGQGGALTTANPLTEGIGWEVFTDGKLYAVTYKGGVRTVIADLSTLNYKDGLPHRYSFYYRTDRTFFYFDGQEVVVATGVFASPNVQKLPLRAHIINGSPPPGTSPQIIILGIGVGDTARNSTQLSDGTYAWRKATVDASGALKTADPILLDVKRSISDYETRLDYAARLDGNPVYVGKNLDGTATSAATWVVQKLDYDATARLTRQQVRINISWDSRVSPTPPWT